MRTPFDDAWFASLLAANATANQKRAPIPVSVALPVVPEPPLKGAADWGEAPDTLGFVGRADELALAHRWVVDERCRLVAILGTGASGA
jgi:hypothetical protein